MESAEPVFIHVQYEQLLRFPMIVLHRKGNMFYQQRGKYDKCQRLCRCKNWVLPGGMPPPAQILTVTSRNPIKRGHSEFDLSSLNTLNSCTGCGMPPGHTQFLHPRNL